MAAAVRLRNDFDAVEMRRLAKRSDDADQTRRLLALAAIYDGGSRTEAAKLAASAFRQFQIGCWLSIPMVRLD